MNAQEMLDDYDRLARLCEAKDVEYKEDVERVRRVANLIHDDHRRKLSEAQAQIAMQAEALKNAASDLRGYENYAGADYAEKAISSTSETVAAWRAKETEPYKREVAMLRKELNHSGCHDEDCAIYGSDSCNCSFGAALADTQATALAYEREVEAKALEEAACIAISEGHHVNHYGIAEKLREKAAELRAANKGEVK